MIIQLSKITKEMAYELNGSEDWMEEIYQGIPTSDPKASPLQVSIRIKPLPEKKFHLDAKLEFSPFLDCSRCGIPIEWPIKKTFSLVFEPTPSTFEKEIDLKTEDLDKYYYKNNEIDVEPILNDLVQTSLPTKVIKKSSNQKNCQVCKKDIDKPLVFESNEEKSNPFSAWELYRQLSILPGSQLLSISG